MNNTEERALAESRTEELMNIMHTIHDMDMAGNETAFESIIRDHFHDMNKIFLEFARDTYCGSMKVSSDLVAFFEKTQDIVKEGLKHLNITIDLPEQFNMHKQIRLL